MLDSVHHTNTDRLYTVAINMIGPLLSVHLLTQHAGHPLSKTVGCWGVSGQHKVLTNGTFFHLVNGSTVGPPCTCAQLLKHLKLRRTFSFNSLIFTHIRYKSPLSKSKLQSFLLHLGCLCHIFKCANIDGAHSVYLHVYYVTSMRVSLRV